MSLVLEWYAYSWREGIVDLDKASIVAKSQLAVRAHLSSHIATDRQTVQGCRLVGEVVTADSSELLLLEWFRLHFERVMDICFSALPGGGKQKRASTETVSVRRLELIVLAMGMFIRKIGGCQRINAGRWR